MVKSLLLCTVLFGACVDTELTSGPYRAEVLVLDGVDPQTGGGRYALRPVDLVELQSLSPMRDRDFNFIDAPRIDFTSLNNIPHDEQAAFVRRAADYTPRLRDIDGIAVPRDLTSLQVLSAYHAFRSVVADIQELTGQEVDAIVPEHGFQVWVRPQLEEAQVSIEMTANAFYMSPIDAFGLVGVDPIEKLPVGALSPVLAHEFGHHLFNRSFDRADGVCDPKVREPNAPGRFATEAAIRGINEGYADLVSFAVTGVSNPIADAFPLDSAGYRSIDVRLPGALAFQFGATTCGDSFYCVGTLFVRSIVEAALLRGVDLNDRAARLTLARDAFRAFDGAPALMRRRTWPVPAVACEVTDDVDPAMVSAFAGAFVEGLPADVRATVCERFAANLGSTAFATVDRGGCP